MRFLWVACVLALPVLAGCITNSPFDSCDSEGQVTVLASAGGLANGATIRVCHAGELRSALLEIPAGSPEDGSGRFPERGLPMLVALHGGGGNAQQFADNARWRDYARAMEVAVLIPQGTPATTAGELRTWNAYHCCGKAQERESDDVGFLHALIDGARRGALGIPIDGSRVGMTGHSNGGMMAYRYAADDGFGVCCIIPVAGALTGGTVGSDDDVPVHFGDSIDVLAMHAEDDAVVPFDGGPSGVSPGVRHIGVQASLAPFIERAGGATGEYAVEEGNGVTRSIVTTADGSRIELVRTTGGHGWPAGDGSWGRAPRAPDASREAIQFVLDA